MDSINKLILTDSTRSKCNNSSATGYLKTKFSILVAQIIRFTDIKWLLFVNFASSFYDSNLRITMSDTNHTAHVHTEEAPKRLSSATYVIAFIVLFLILAVFADLFVFILGSIGLVVTFAALYKETISHDSHH